MVRESKRVRGRESRLVGVKCDKKNAKKDRWGKIYQEEGEEERSVTVL